MAGSIDKNLRKAKALAKKNAFSEAAEIYTEILKKFPKNQRAKQGLQELRLGISSTGGKKEPPIELEQEVINLFNQGKYQVVIQRVKQLLSSFPKSSSLWSLMGASFIEVRQFNEAIECCKRSLQLNSKNPESFYNIGTASSALGKIDTAISNYNKAISINENYFLAYNSLGIIFKNRGLNQEAIKMFEKATTINPLFPDAFNNLGAHFMNIGQYTKAVEMLEKAIAIKNDYTEAYFNLGAVAKLQKKLELSIKNFEAALKIKPDFELARSQKMLQQAHICDWVTLEKDLEFVPKLGVFDQEISALPMMAFEDAPDRHQVRAKKHALSNFMRTPLPAKPVIKNNSAKIRVGYFSTDFKTHPVYHQIARVLELHDRDNFEIFGYSLGAKTSDPMTDRAVNSFDSFHQVENMSDKDIALLAREDDLDLAIDLNGYTAGCRPGIFAYRAAPVQINFLGFPGTMGANFIDYIIGDSILMSPNLERFYDEKIIKLPNSYMPNDNTRIVSNKNITRSEMGLPENGFVFCCFNNNYKITPSEFDIWMKVLKKVEGSVLWLRNSNDLSEKNLCNEAERRGVDAARLVFAQKVPMDIHLARQKLADLFLDTFVYNAHSTATEALWLGLPVVTKIGKSFASRVAASLLTSLDMKELITETEEEYESIICDFAENPKRLHAIKEKLEGNRLSGPLFNSELYTKNIEKAYEQVYKNYQNGDCPKAVDLSKI